MNFNPGRTKQAQEVIFSRYLQNTNHLCLIFNHNSVSLTKSLKHIGIILDFRLDFKKHLEIIFKKFCKTIGLLRRLPALLPRKSLITICKAFIRSHMDYGDIIYDQAYNASFHRKPESIKYNATLAITDVMRGRSREKFYQELDFELYNKEEVSMENFGFF